MTTDNHAQTIASFWKWQAIDWDRFVAPLEGDVAFFVEAAQEAGSPVLEIGCGTGRTLIPIAQSGIEIVGLDLSESMLAEAQQKVIRLDSQTQQRIQLVQGDMRDFSLGRKFNLVLVTFAFVFLTTPEAQREALACIAKHLAESGRLIITNPDPKLDLLAAYLAPLGNALKQEKMIEREETNTRVIVWASRQYDPSLQILKSTYLYEEADAEGTVIGRHHHHLVSRQSYRFEMQHLFASCGYEINALYGDFKRKPFAYGDIQIWVVRKKEGVKQMNHSQ